MSEPLPPNPTCVAPSPENNTAPASSEAVTATPELVNPVDSTEAAATTTTTVEATPASEQTEAAPTEAAPAETVPTEKTPENAPAETTSTPAPAITTAAATEKQPATPERVEKVETPAIATTAPVISSGMSWPALDEHHPLAQFQARLPELLKNAEYNHIWGITLSADEPIPFHTTLVLQKFLRANCNKVDAAYTQLLETLKWRKAYNPVAACDEEFSETKFGGLGYVMKTQTKDGERIVTYNIYGACKEPKRTFGDLDSFLRWRIALMEMGVRALDLPSATVPIPDYNAAAPGSAIDPYQMIQLHDYQNVSFLRMDPTTKAASKKTIEVMANYYPELLSIKYFVNIPVVMGWVFTAMKAILSKETVRKFRVFASGKGVANDLGSDEVPKAYGGKGADLAEAGLRPKLLKDTPPPSEKEKKPSKKSSMASLDKVKEKVAEVIAPAAEPKESSPTAPAPTVATIPEAKEEEAAAEKVDSPPTVPAKDISDAPVVPAKEEAVAASEAPATPAKDVTSTPDAEAPAVPAKDESSVPAEAAVSNTVVEGSTTVEEPASSCAGAAASENAAELAPVAVEEAQAEKEESANKESLPVAPVSTDKTADVEEKLDESNATAEESKPAAQAETLA